MEAEEELLTPEEAAAVAAARRQVLQAMRQREQGRPTEERRRRTPAPAGHLLGSTSQAPGARLGAQRQSSSPMIQSPLPQRAAVGHTVTQDLNGGNVALRRSNEVGKIICSLYFSQANVAKISFLQSRDGYQFSPQHALATAYNRAVSFLHIQSRPILLHLT